MDIFRLIRRNLLRDKRRTLLTLASVSLVVVLLAVLLTVYNTLQATVNDPRAQRILAIRDATALGLNGLPEGYSQELRKIAGITDVMPWNFIFARVEPHRGLTGIAVEPAALPRLMPPLVKGIPAEQFRAFVANPRGVLMGRELMQRYRWKIGDTVTLIGGSVDADFPVKIEGLLRFDMLGDNFLMHHGYFRAVYCDCEVVPTNVIFFRVEDQADVAAVRQAVERRFRAEPVQIELITIVDFVGEIVSQSGDASRLVFFIMVIIALATLLVVGNMLAMSMRERSRDIAILRTLGFRARHVAGLVLGEAGLIALLGSALGGLAAYVAFHATGFSLRMGAQSYFTVGGLTVLESVTAGLVMGLLAGLGPALASLRMGVADTLRKVV